MRALRVRPPEVPWTPELLWVLSRAYGPPEVAFDGPFDGTAAAGLASSLDLAARIGARNPPPVLSAEAGEDAAAGFVRAARLTAARNLFRIESVRAVAKTAARGGIPFVLLKGLALEALSLVPAGSRPTSDLDLLVPVGRIPAFLDLLIADGWVLTPEHGDQEQHLEPLVHPGLGMIEVHRVLLGVRLPGQRRSLDFDALSAAGLTRPVPGLPESVLAPANPVLLAHSLVHGLVQHGSAPASYPAFRVLSDVADLGPSPESLAEAGAYLRELDSEDLATVGTLVRDLGSGLRSTLCGPQSVERRPDPILLLRHLVAGITDRRYALGLKSEGGFISPLSDRPPVGAALRSAWRAVALSRAQVDVIYGPPRTRLGYLARQAWRPFDLVGRYLRASAARRR